MLFFPRLCNLCVLFGFLALVNCATDGASPGELIVLAVSAVPSGKVPSTLPVNNSTAKTPPPVHGPPAPVTVPPPTAGPTPPTTVHSGCYAYLEKKDGCVYRTAKNNCLAKKTSIQIEQFGVDTAPTATPGGFAAQGVVLDTPSTNSTGVLEANTTKSGVTTFPKARGRRAVPPPLKYEPKAGTVSSPLPLSPTAPAPPAVTSGGTPGVAQGICGPYYPDVDAGVCVWDGTDKDGNDPSKSGWINSALTTNCNKQVTVKRGTITQTFKLLNGCSFATAEPAQGCSQIYLTKAAFTKLNPTAEESANGAFLDTLYWDFLESTPPV